MIRVNGNVDTTKRIKLEFFFKLAREFLKVLTKNLTLMCHFCSITETYIQKLNPYNIDCLTK